MDNLTKELIAVGASVAANCGPCLKYHVDKAREFGADRKQIDAAVGVGKLVRKGAAGKMDQFISAGCEGSPDGGEATDADCSCGG